MPAATIADDLLGFSRETLRIGALMRDAGYRPAPAIENQDARYTALPWHGSLKDVAARLTTLRQERDEAQHRLDDALLGDYERAAATAAIAEKNRSGQLKTRGDGSQYRKFPDGRIEECEA